jgi:ABC-type Mn2+/Zn2+ transport system permease subunit
MIAWLIAPLSYAFMQRGMLAAILVGVACAVIGCYVILRSMASGTPWRTRSSRASPSPTY